MSEFFTKVGTPVRSRSRTPARSTSARVFGIVADLHRSLPNVGYHGLITFVFTS